MSRNFARVGLLAVAAVLAIGSGGSGASQRKASRDTSGGDSDLVFVKRTMDTADDTLPLFERGAKNMGCSVDYTKTDDGTPILVASCSSDGVIAVAQDGKTVVIGCSKSKHNESSCESYAVRVIRAVGN